MSPVFVVFCIIAFVIPVALCIVYKNKIESMSTDLGILKKRNETLEERFSNEESNHSSDSAAGKIWQSGMEILQQFAQSHQVKLEKVEDYEDEHYELYGFLYQGGYFRCFVGKQSDEVLLRFYSFFDIPYSQDAVIEVLRLCDAVTSKRKYAKLTYHLDKEDPDNISLDLYYEMIGISQDGLEHLLAFHFGIVSEVREAAEKLCKDLYGERYAEAKSVSQSEPCLSMSEPIRMISYENSEDK